MNKNNLPDDDNKLWDFLRWNSYVSERHKLFYVATPKVACTSLKWWFAELEGISREVIQNAGSEETDPELIIHDALFKVAPDVTGLGIDALAKILESEEYFRFAVVRNPYKRIFSAWQSKLLLREPIQIGRYVKCEFFNREIRNKVDIALAFEGFLEHINRHESPNFQDVHWALQFSLLRPDIISYSKLVKIEQAKDLTAAMRERYGPLFPDPFGGARTNESIIPYSPDLITEKSAVLIQSLYREDFEVFNYAVRPPEAAEAFSSEQFEIAIKAIHFIRARHQRFGEMRCHMQYEIANRDNQLAERNNQLDAYKIQADQFDTQLRAAIVQINSLNQAVSERDGQIVLYKNQSDKFVEQINAAIANADSLAQALAQRDIQVANLNQEVAQRKEQIVNLNQEAAQREKQVVNLNQEVAGRDHELFALRNSTSWKITKPLRILSSLASGNWKEIHLSDNKVLRKLSRMAKRSYLELTQNLEALPKDFDAETYLKLNSDIAVSGIDPATHYLLHGRHEGRKYLLPALDMRGGLNFQTDRETILVVSHEASRTGAPILSLNIVQSLTRRYNVVALLLGGGPLSNEFQKSGAGVITAANLKHNPVMAELLMGQLCTRFNFKFALVNSIESREVLPALCNCFVPTISLLHEFASYTRPRDAFRYALFWSGEAVFSTKITLESALEEYPDLCDHSAHVLPQGRCLLPAEVSAEEQAIESARIRRLIRPKGIGEDSLVILGAGFVQLRKGVDLFIDCAARVVRTPQGRKCRFVWVGKGYDPDIDVGYSVYLADQIRRAGLQDHVFFIDETTAIETAYEEADLLLISSRLDPLPNVAIDAMVHGVPVICFDRTTGIADFLNDNGLGEYCVAAYLDAGDMADKILVLASSQSIREDVATRCREASVAYFNMDNYVAQLEVLAHEVEGQVQQELADTQMILGSGLFRKDYAIPYHGQNQSPEKLVRAYVRAWASGIGRRKPFPGFHPGVYLEQHGVAVSGADPFADYLRAGKPEGPWCNPVIVAGEAMQNEPPDNLRVALHIHAYYPELLPEIISRLSRNRICPDLFVSVTNEQARNQAISLLKDYKGKVVDILLVPNRGRDIGPFLTAFGTRILTGYDYVGHIHTKKSVDVKDAAIGQVWYQFLLENLLGGESGSMVDRILIRMENDASIGMVFPDDPNVVGWSANRDFAEPFADRMGIEKLPEHFVFPVGTMFWARVSALAPLINLNLEWNDYPEEPLPYDGSSLHALERLFPLVLSSRNLRNATTNVIGLTR